MKKHILFILGLGLVISLNIYYRSFPINFPQLKIQAKNTVEQGILKQAAQEVERNFPEYSSLAKNRLIKTLFSNYKQKEKETIKKQIQEEHFKLKDKYQDANGQTYLMELDCWHWGRYVDNLLRLGHIGDKLVNTKQFNALMLAPSGRQVEWYHFLFYLSAFLYKVFSLIKVVPLFTFLFYLPLFFTTIFIIVLYLFCYYRWGNLSALMSCLFVGLAPIFLARSCAGWFDTDIFNLLFPLLITGTYLIADETTTPKKRFSWLCLSGFWVGLFSFTWGYWWFIFLIIIIYEIYSLANLFFIYLQYKEKNPDLFKKHLISLSAFLFFSLFWIIILAGFQPIVFFYSQFKGALTLNKPLSLSLIWPNVFSTVLELRKVSFLGMANVIGGIFLFLASLLCLVGLFLHTTRNPKYTLFERELIVVLVLWFLGMFFACLKGIRFTAFLLIPLGVSLGWAITKIYVYWKNKWKKFGVVFMIATLTIIFSARFIANAYNTARNIFPMMNDTYYRALLTIKEVTPPEAIINSWWDFGDWFKTVSQRRVIFDGHSQDTPQAYWIAKVLISRNEREAVGILRMLNNGGNQAFEIVNKHLKDPFQSVLLLEKVIVSSALTAKNNLLEFLPLSVVDEIMQLLFSQPDPAYFVVDSTMVGKISPISYLGNWDFSKVYLVQNLQKEKIPLTNYLMKLGKSASEAEQLYQEVLLISPQDLEDWVTHRLQFYTRRVNGKQQGDIVYFENGLVYNLKEEKPYWYCYKDSKYKVPQSLAFFEGDKLKEVVYPDGELNFSVLIIKNQEDYQAVLLDRELINSLFVRLYFLDGADLQHFRPFTEERSRDETYIRVFKIIWD